ncbi:uncharacterized protein isoform X1 [Danio rerio]|uniref:Uncharacterized protein isoform X1 n=1 Tax=Danio rerio TaxID=7955 RepID=A0AC58IQG8_DANRE
MSIMLSPSRELSHNKIEPIANEESDTNVIVQSDGDQSKSCGFCGYILTFFSCLLIFFTFPVSVWFCMKVVQEYERAVIFRLGRLLGGAKGPGLFWIIPCMDTFRKVDLRTVSFDIPAQEAVLYSASKNWGIKVERVELKDVKLPTTLQRAMAAEAEASRDARAKVIAAEGEMKASRALKEAANVMSESPAALQLRYMQTLTEIASERNSTIIFPVPMDLMSGFMRR